MDKISKTVANKIAIKLTENLQLRIKEIDSELNQIYIEEKYKSTPKEVVDLFKKYPSYFRSKSAGYIHYLGQNYYISNKISIPDNNISLSIEGDIAEKFNKLVQELETTKNKKSKLIREFEETILMLGTAKRLEDNFPEAFVFLSANNQTSIAIDLKDIREKVQQVFNLAIK